MPIVSKHKYAALLTAASLATGAAALNAERVFGDDGGEERVTMAPAAKQLERSVERFVAIQRRRAARAPSVLGVSRSTLDAIASCESGGNPRAISSGGDYRGKYQFHPSTWASVGGSGDPAAAPEVEQDIRAALLYSRSSSSPWPVCG